MMNKILFGLGMALSLLGTSCGPDDTPQAQPARPHADVYPEDLAKIEEYLKTHYLIANDFNGSGDIEVGDVEVGGVIMKEIEILPLDETHTVSVWDQQDYPLQSKIVKLYGVDFKLYYLKFDGKGDTDADGDKPCGVDNVFVSYRGLLLDGTQFDYAPNPTVLNLVDVIKGWVYMMPEFRDGYFDPQNEDGTLNPRNFGSGVMFLPSGLGYYNSGFGNIPSYSPLVFTFNLCDVIYTDIDNDKIESRYEYVLKPNGYLVDSDSDNIPDVFDADDDNDGYLTKNEIKYNYIDGSGETQTTYYPYNGAAADDPATIGIDESKGIPTCGDTDFTTPTRKRKHVDSSCH